MLVTDADISAIKNIIGYYQGKFLNTDRPVVLLFLLDSIFDTGIYATENPSVFVGIVDHQELMIMKKEVMANSYYPVVISRLPATDRHVVKVLNSHVNIAKKNLNLPASDIRNEASKISISGNAFDNASVTSILGKGKIADSLLAFNTSPVSLPKHILPLYTLVELTTGVRTFIAGGYDYSHKAEARGDHQDLGYLYSLCSDLDMIYKFHSEPEHADIHRRYIQTGYDREALRVVESAASVRHRLRGECYEFFDQTTIE